MLKRLCELDRLPAKWAASTLAAWSSHCAKRAKIERKSLDNSLDEFFINLEDIDDATSRPFWYEPVRRLATRPLHNWYWERDKRRTLGKQGWHFTDTWSLDHVLCERLAAQLAHLADNTHGWPGNEEFPTFEDWAAALKDTSAKLLEYYNTTDLEYMHEKYPLPDIRDDWDSKESRAKIAARDEWEKQVYEDAKQALHWVADHLGSLWD